MKNRLTFLVVCSVLCAGIYLIAGNAHSTPKSEDPKAAAPAGSLQAPQDESIGVKAALAVNELDKQAADTYQKVSVQVDKTSQELQANAGQLMAGLSTQAQQLNQQLQQVYQDMLAKYQVELQKFQETLKKAREKDRTK